MFEKSGTMRIVLHVIIVLLKLKRKQFGNIPMNLKGIIREMYHINIRRHNMPSDKNNFDFSLIVDDCESSDGQKRHQYINAKETKTETVPETIQK
jgi:hypothetical protein